MPKHKKNNILNIQGIWESIKPDIEKAINHADTYSRWIEGIVPVSFDGKIISLGVADEFTADWIQMHFEPIIKSHLHEKLGQKFKIKYLTGYQVEQKKEDESEEEQNTTYATANNSPSISSENESKNDDYTFANYVVGPENRFAYAAAYGAATGEGIAPNPLFFYGRTSCGKTHLLKAVANEVKARNKNKVVEYVSCEDFLNIYVDSLRKKTHYEFRNRFRNVDYLLIDDVQMMANSPRLQEEFFNTFNCLHSENKNIMLTSDKLPSEINGLEARLVSRFESGLTLEIEPYGEETRLAILRKKQEKHKIKIDDQILRFIAKNISSHVRKLEGALNRLIGAALYAGCEINMKNAKTILKPYLEEAAVNRITIEKIQKVVADYYDLRVSDLTSKKRPNNIAMPRMIAMFLCRKLTDRSLPDIGESFGRNHATVIHAVNKIEKDIPNNTSLSNLISQLKRRVEAGD